MSDWIEWHGGEQPVADDVVVEIRMRDESEWTSAASHWKWDHLPNRELDGDIIAYRIVSQDSELDRLRAENAALLKIKECAQRLVDHAESKLGGCLSDDSPARDIPSNAVSMVKARHLASLRAALQGAKDDHLQKL